MPIPSCDKEASLHVHSYTGYMSLRGLVHILTWKALTWGNLPLHWAKLWFYRKSVYKKTNYKSWKILPWIQLMKSCHYSSIIAATVPVSLSPVISYTSSLDFLITHSTWNTSRILFIWAKVGRSCWVKGISKNTVGNSIKDTDQDWWESKHKRRWLWVCFRWWEWEFTLGIVN